jgi:hypothetical protein
MIGQVHLLLAAWLLGPSPVSAQARQVMADMPLPPAPHVEPIPPPSEEARVMYWKPGQWMWDGASWTWKQGHYDPMPAPGQYWTPGH